MVKTKMFDGRKIQPEHLYWWNGSKYPITILCQDRGTLSPLGYKRTVGDMCIKTCKSIPTCPTCLEIRGNIH